MGIVSDIFIFPKIPYGIMLSSVFELTCFFSTKRLSTIKRRRLHSNANSIRDYASDLYNNNDVAWLLLAATCHIIQYNSQYGDRDIESAARRWK